MKKSEARVHAMRDRLKASGLRASIVASASHVAARKTVTLTLDRRRSTLLDAA